MDLSHLPPGFKGDLKVFKGGSTVDNLQWYAWVKPRGCSMLFALCIGGGAGGGGGFSAAAAAARGGGGGGGSSCITKVLIPLIFLPDRLFVQVGNGTVGVAAGAAAVPANSYIAVYPHIGNSKTNFLAVSSINGAPTGGGTGMGAAVGTGGSAGTVSIQGDQCVSGSGFWSTIAGQGGGAGGAIAGGAGTSITLPLTGLCTVGGAGGGGTTAADFAGGGITSVANTWLNDKRSAAPAAGTFDGAGGLLSWNPLWSFCGLGGSASNAGVGGNGGKGGPGSGGGGGGGGTTGGRGGDGGPGLVVMACW